MNKKAIGILIANIFLCYGLIAELSWWSPQELPLVKGWVDSHDIAINKNGKVIALFGDKIFGNYDIATNQWNFIKLDMDSEEVKIQSIQSEENIKGFDEIVSNGQKAVLNEYDEGFVVFRLTEGPNKGKIGCLSYLNDSWGSITLLSEGVGSMPVIAQTPSGRAIAVWVNKEKDNENCLMGAYYNGFVWVNQGVISQYKSVKMNYSQRTLQLAMNDIGDAIVVWKASNAENSEEDNGCIIANYFNGIEDKWGDGEILAEQSQNKTGIHLSMNGNGDAFVVWDSDQGIEGGFFNLNHYMLKNTDEIKNLTASEWTKGCVAQGEKLSAPKVAVDDRGNGVAIWLQRESGMSSSYYNIANKAWSGEIPMCSKTAYTGNLQVNENGIYAIWVEEGSSSEEHVFGAFFDTNSNKWRNYQDLHLRDEKNSFIDDVDSFSLAQKNQGMVIWYDFFKEHLFYSLLKEGADLAYIQSTKDIKRAILSKRNAEISKYKALRKELTPKFEKKYKRTK